MSPIINSYKDLVEFNNNLKSDFYYNIESVSYKENTVYYTTPYTPLASVQSKDLDNFMYDYATKNPLGVLTGKLYRLKKYDFTKLLYKMNPDEFMKQFESFVNNLLAIGETEFTLWDMNIKLVGEDIILTSFINPNLKEIVIPYFITEIADNTFLENKNLERVIIAEGSKLTKIGTCAFKASGLEEINLPDTLQEIGKEAFRFTHLKIVDIPSSLTMINQNTFGQCQQLETVNIKPQSSLKIIHPFAFINTAIKNITLPESLENIGFGAFKNCTHLENIVIPDNVEEVGVAAFLSCVQLKSFTFGKKVRKIEDTVLDTCTKLKNIEIKGDINYIGDRAFAFTAIEELVVPKSVIKDGDRAKALSLIRKATRGCKRLDNIEFK